MPHHLVLPDPQLLPLRRPETGEGDAPHRRRGEHGRQLRQQLVEAVAAPRRIDPGVDHALAFKLTAVCRPGDAAFEGRGLQLLGESLDHVHFVLADDGASALAEALDRYVQTGLRRSFFDLIEKLEPYGADDRRGPGLDGLEPTASGLLTVDVGVWPASPDGAQARVQVVEAVLARTGGKVLLRSVDPRRPYLRVQVDGEGLADLLATSVVELVRTPPEPFLDFRDRQDLAIDELARVKQPGAVVGVLDDAPAVTHPLLAGLVLSVDSLAPDTYQWQRPGSHGTEVVGRVLYPTLYEELRDHEAITAFGAVRVLRVLEPDPHRVDAGPRFASYDFPHEVVAQGIRYLHGHYGVKVFNLSVGYAESFDRLHIGPFTEVIDDLVRELGIVVVVPTGNAEIGLDSRTAGGQHIIEDKPGYLFAPEHRLSEPGPAALAVTVGSIAPGTAVSGTAGSGTAASGTAGSGAPGAAADGGHVGWHAAADADEISPFSRSGPGLGATQGGADKPDVTHYGGNAVVDDSGNAVRHDLGPSIISTSSPLGDGRLLTSVKGTSFAAPAVARIAADIAYEYPDASGNLIRALLATSAALPTPAAALTEPLRRQQVYGYGKPSTHRATTSDPHRVTMTYDGRLPVDGTQIHPLPVPELFRRGSGGARTIVTALAFDPPVSRRRREYLAATMQIDLYRDLDPGELADLLGHEADLGEDPRRLRLDLGTTSFTNSTLHLRRWTTEDSFVDAAETFSVVVTHCAHPWAADDADYREQAYALAVTLDDPHLGDADLQQLLTEQVHLPARRRGA